MPMSDDIDFDALTDIQAAVEAAGGDVKGFEAKTVGPEGPLAAIQNVFGTGGHPHYLLEICVPGPTTDDIPDVNAGIDAEDAAHAVAVAHTWADQQGLDALAADLHDVGQRVSDQATGESHPTDEMALFEGGDNDD